MAEKDLKSLQFGVSGDIYKVHDTKARADLAELAGQVDELAEAVDNIDISSLEGVATEEYVDNAIEALEIPDITGLATEQYVDNAVTGLATEQYVDNAIEAIEIPDTSNLQSKIDAQHKLDVALVDGAVTSEQLEGLATEDYVDEAISDIELPGMEGLQVAQDETELTKDLVITDANDNVLAEFSNGHIKTKNFDSSNIDTSVSISLPFQSFKGLTVGFLGDSITAGSSASPSSNRYTSKFCEIAECTEKNMGIGGTCLANNTKNGASGSRFLTRVTSANMNNLDFLFISGGTNDFSYDIKPVGDHFAEETRTGNTYIGTKVRVANPDNETFSGALHELILAIRALKPDLPIVYINMLTRNEYSSEPRPSSRECNANGNYLSDFNDAINDICAFYSIPVFDVRNHFPNDFYSSTKYCASDHLHPNNAGHLALAQALYRWAITNLAF